MKTILTLGIFMGRLSKADKVFREKVGMTPLEFARMIRRQVSEKIDRRLEQKQPSE
jgi:hypothetical protein